MPPVGTLGDAGRDGSAHGWLWLSPRFVLSVHFCTQNDPGTRRIPGSSPFSPVWDPLDDLRKVVLGFTDRGVHVRFEKENLTFTGADSPMSHLLLSVMGAFAQFERDLIRERQREGIALAKLREGAYVGRKHCLNPAQAKELRQRVAAGESKTALAGELGISRQTLYRYVAGAGK